ncbi:MAG: asparagine synthase (glutamine-hydrolyzing) [Candidatus Scalindua sp.]|nr:asparagine synthase (glutamine-hydrolyzing) [Candidatus Scalindua sp.]
MCGFTGFFSHGAIVNNAEVVCRKMVDTLIHRGPDDSGVWLDDQAGIAMGHRRLSIQDLSPEGLQPMVSSSGRFIIVFNGEIYNFLELKKELEQKGITFRGHSDTEMLLASVERWGQKIAVERFVGMFAFALWDRQERVLTLVRDRLGEKPLYYGWQGKTFLFGSELKALRVHPEWQGEINRDVLALYMRHSYIPAPYSIYKGIAKLLPGTMLRVPANNLPGNLPDPLSYWSVKTVAEYGEKNTLDISDEEAIERLDALLRRSIRGKMLADVPLGAFLSGGIDSSTVVAIMQAESNRPVKTFTIGFSEEGYNEAKHAKLIARHLGTEHTELYVTPEQAMEVIHRLPTLYDEPFSDSSQIPTLLVSEMTRRHVTVALSGDGGDELFGGYNRYHGALAIWKKIGWMSNGGRKLFANLLNTIPIGALNKMFFWTMPIIKKYGRPGNAGDKLHKLSEVLAMESPDSLYANLVSHWRDTSSLVPGSNEPLTALTDPVRQAVLKDFAQRMMFLDTVSYLPDDILCKVDRASMGVSLEVRVPLLDHRLVEFAWRLPLTMKIRNGEGKWLLRQVLYKYVPRDMMERPKMGFGVPIGAWLSGPLRGWAEELLGEARLKREGFFDCIPIKRKWEEHLSGMRNWHYYLWDVLMFQAWLDKEAAFGKSSGSW